MDHVEDPRFPHAGVPSDMRAAPKENSMSNPNLFGAANRAGTIADQAAYDAGLRQHMLRVYNYMASGLVLSGIVAYGLFASPALASLFFEVEAGGVVGLNTLGWIAIFAPLGLLM